MQVMHLLVIFHCRRGIEGLNDELLTRGFAMNEEGGIVKASCHSLLQSYNRTKQAKTAVLGFTVFTTVANQHAT